MEFSWQVLILAALVSLVGSFIQSTTGFGYAVTVMAIWPLFLPFKTAVVAETATALFMSAAIALRYRKYIVWRQLLWPVAASFVMNGVGVLLLDHIPEHGLRRILGVILVLLAVWFIFFSERVHIRPTTANGLAAGAVSGLSGGLCSIGGPPIVAYYINAFEDKREYTATTQMFFIFSVVWLLILHTVRGNLDMAVLEVSAVSLIGLAAGTAAGMALFKKLPMAAIKKLVYGFMLVMGVYTVMIG